MMGFTMVTASALTFLMVYLQLAVIMVSHNSIPTLFPTDCLSRLSCSEYGANRVCNYLSYQSSTSLSVSAEMFLQLVAKMRLLLFLTVVDDFLLF